MRAFALAALLFTTPVAASCPMAGFDAGKVSPSDGASGVAPDGALVIPFEVEPGASWCWESDWLTSPGWSVSVAPAEGSPITGTTAYFDHESHCAAPAREVFAWRPTSPFAPNTKYEVSVAYQGPGSASSHVLKSSFTTGAALLPPLAFSGALQVTTAVKKQEYQHCMQPDMCGGGGGCTLEVREEVVATISGVKITGGQESSGYDVAVTVGKGAPEGWQSHWRPRSHVAAGAPVELEVVLSDGGEAYSPCFVLYALDATGRPASTAPVCLDPIEPGTPAGGGPSPGTKPEPDPGMPVAESSEDGGCSFRHPTRESSWLGWCSFLAMALVLRRRGHSGTRST